LVFILILFKIIKKLFQQLQQKNEQMLKRLESEASELDERRRQLELEIRDWESSSGISLDELRRRSLEREYVIFLTNIIIAY